MSETNQSLEKIAALVTTDQENDTSELNSYELELHKSGLNIVALKYGLVLAYILYFLLNFTASPILKESYLFLLCMHFSIIILFTPEEAIPAMLALSFVEGQGRVMWGYNPAFRIVFDICLMIICMKIIILRRRMLSTSIIPLPVRALIFCHFCWWSLELLNFTGAGFFASIATAKFYIFPFILFFAFSLLDLTDKEFLDRKVAFIVTALIIVSTILCIYQMSEGERIMAKISGNYVALFEKYKEFTAGRFRPWGTTHNPGGQSIYIYLTVGFIFICLGHIGGKLKHFLFLIIMGLSWFTLFINNVRSAFIKHILIFIGCSIIYFLSSKRKFMSFRNSIIAVMVGVVFITFNLKKFDSVIEELNLQNAVNRIKALDSKGGVTSQRGGFKKFYHHVSLAVDWPFGFGPGMTTGYLPQFEARRQKIIGIPDYHFWAGDNLLLFLFLEMGIGGFFYLAIMILNLGFLAQMSFKLYQRDQKQAFQIVGICFVSVLVITIGQWGAVGLPFNPESLYYWLWVAIGYCEYYKANLRYNNLAVPHYYQNKKIE